MARPAALRVGIEPAADNRYMTAPIHPLPTLRRVAFERGPWPLHDVAASRAIESAALARHAPGALMGRAGFAVARLALAVAAPGAPFTVVVGPGNNGGDGLVAARHLHQAGQRVQVLLAADPLQLPPDAAAALASARAGGVRISTALPACVDADSVVIDALLGLGARPIAEGTIAQALRLLATATGAVLAIDLPSGLHADTGALLSEYAVIATHTLSLLTLKPGLFTNAGRDHAGLVWLDSLDETLPMLMAMAMPIPIPTAWLGGPPPRTVRTHTSHKGRFGDVLVVGGAEGMAGAATLAASAALAAGAGRVYVSALNGLDKCGMPAELMTRRHAWLLPPVELQSMVAVCGCGGGGLIGETLPPLLAHAARVVLDADALNAIANEPQLRRQLTRRGTDSARATVLTPHPLEAARLLGTTTSQVQGDRLKAACALAAEFGATVVLKGSGTIVAPPDGVPLINPTGNASLATAGTGDVLAGWIGGLWAQWPEHEAAEIAARAVWHHGAAADRFVAGGHLGPLLASALIDAMTSGG